jgi:hypothetical protein
VFFDSTAENVKVQVEKPEGRGGTRYLPYAFTEQGIAMLSGVLSSDRAINMNIAIMGDEKASEKKWNERERIGFKSGKNNN